MGLLSARLGLTALPNTPATQHGIMMFAGLSGVNSGVLHLGSVRGIEARPSTEARVHGRFRHKTLVSYILKGGGSGLAHLVGAAWRGPGGGRTLPACSFVWQPGAGSSSPRTAGRNRCLALDVCHPGIWLALAVSDRPATLL